MPLKPADVKNMADRYAEAWSLSDDVRVIESDGRFDAAEYERQIAEGI